MLTPLCNSGHAYRGTKVGLLLAQGNNFGWMLFLPPPVTYMGTNRNWTQVCRVHSSTTDPTPFI